MPVISHSSFTLFSNQLWWFSSESYTALQEGNATLPLFQNTTGWTNLPCLTGLKNWFYLLWPIKMIEASYECITESLGLKKNMVCYCRWKLRVQFDIDLKGMSCSSLLTGWFFIQYSHCHSSEAEWFGAWNSRISWTIGWLWHWHIGW